MDDGYWVALLRDVEEELDPVWTGGDPEDVGCAGRAERRLRHAPMGWFKRGRR